MYTPRLAAIASCTAAAVLLSACVSRPVVVNVPPAPAPVAAVPSTTMIVTAPASIETGRITNIEYIEAKTATSGINVPGAVVGGIAGAVVGNALGNGRDAATVLGGAAGAAVGSQVGRTTTVSSVYRMTIQTDSGSWRTYDVPATGDLRVGDRVRIENGVISHA